jgi:hypothetical protein
VFSEIWKSATRTEKKVVGGIGAFFLFLLTLGVTSAAAWVTHVIVTIKEAEWIFLAVGAIVAPVGVIHGIGVWFGVF